MRTFRWAYPPSSSLLMWQSDVPLFKSLVCSSRRWHISVLISRMRSWFTRAPFLAPIPRLHAKVCPDETSYVSYQCPVRNVVRAERRKSDKVPPTLVFASALSASHSHNATSRNGSLVNFGHKSAKRSG